MNMPYTIRSLVSEDVPFLWEMLYQAIYVPADEPPFPRASVNLPEFSRYVQDWEQPTDSGLIAVTQDGEDIGAAWLRLLTGSQRGHGYVDDATPELTMAIVPAWRGQGLGRRLLERMLDEAQTQFSAVCLSVDPQNMPALKLYERLGFEVTGKNGTSLTMLRQL